MNRLIDCLYDTTESLAPLVLTIALGMGLGFTAVHILNGTKIDISVPQVECTIK